MKFPLPSPFDIVQADDHYGIVFELLEGFLFQQEIEENREKIVEYGKIFGNLARKLHAIELPEKSWDVPEAKERL